MSEWEVSPEEVHTYFGGTVEPWELVGNRPAGQPQSDTGVCNTHTADTNGS